MQSIIIGSTFNHPTRQQEIKFYSRVIAHCATAEFRGDWIALMEHSGCRGELELSLCTDLWEHGIWVQLRPG